MVSLVQVRVLGAGLSRSQVRLNVNQDEGEHVRHAYTPLLGRHPGRGDRAGEGALRTGDGIGKDAGGVCPWAQAQARYGISGLGEAGSRKPAEKGTGSCCVVGRCVCVARGCGRRHAVEGSKAVSHVGGR